MINSHLLYRLSYRGTTARMLLIKKGKSTLCGWLLSGHDAFGLVGAALAATAVVERG